MSNFALLAACFWNVNQN